MGLESVSFEFDVTDYKTDAGSKVKLVGISDLLKGTFSGPYTEDYPRDLVNCKRQIFWGN